MKDQLSFANQKIAIFIAFVCAALLASVLIFHMRNHSFVTPLTKDEGLLFPAARDIGTFELTIDDRSFTQKDFLGHWTLLLFGFAHCSNVCPITLNMLGHIYDQLHIALPNLQVVFVSLDPDRDTIEKISRYAHSFHPKFMGVTGRVQELHKLQAQLGVISIQDKISSSHYELQHTSSIMLINPQAKWAGLFKFGQAPQTFSNIIRISIAYLSK